VVPSIAPEIRLEDVLCVEPVQSQQVGNKPSPASPAPPRALKARGDESSGPEPEAQEEAGEATEEPRKLVVRRPPDLDGIPEALQGLGGGLDNPRDKWKKR